MHLVHDHGAQVRKESLRMLRRHQKRQLLRRGQQDIRRLRALPLPP
jgi:hypothetical protein